MAVPRKKHSKTQTKMRHKQRQRVNLKRLSDIVNIGKCTNCWAMTMSHTVCPKCWYYNGKQVVTIKTKSKEKVVEA
jgi:large subunit ribosomal protein L32